MKPATGVNEFTLDIIEFCENDPLSCKIKIGKIK